MKIDSCFRAINKVIKGIKLQGMCKNVNGLTFLRISRQKRGQKATNLEIKQITHRLYINKQHLFVTPHLHVIYKSYAYLPELARITSGHFRTTQWHSAKTSGTFPEASHFPARFLGREIRNEREYRYLQQYNNE